MNAPPPARADAVTSLLARRKLTDADWNFSPDRVPDNELIPCLLWEFLRESPTARQLGQESAERIARAREAQTSSVAQPNLRAIKLVINYPVRFDDFIIRTIHDAWGWNKLADVPWQKLSPKAKEFLAEPCTLVNKPVFIGYEMHAGQLAKAVTEATKAEMDKTKDGGVLSLPRARASLRVFTTGQGWEALCVVVDWGRYDDNAIRDGFTKLAAEILKTRPNGTNPQVCKESGLGNPNEWRGKLHSLGRTRLYCYYDGVDHLKRANLTAYNWVVAPLGDKGERAAGKALADAKGRFVRAFHEILPFEKKCFPLCVQNSRFTK